MWRGQFGIPSCRINPIMRADLAAMVTIYAIALQGEILEPKPVPMPEPANDDAPDKAGNAFYCQYKRGR